MGGGGDRRDACPALRRCRYFQTAQTTSTSSSTGTAAMRPTCSTRHMVKSRATDQRISTTRDGHPQAAALAPQRQPPQHDQAEHERADLHHHLLAAIDLQPLHREAGGQRLLAGVEDFGEGEGLAGARHLDADGPHARGRRFGLWRSDAAAAHAAACQCATAAGAAPARTRCGERLSNATGRHQLVPAAGRGCRWGGAMFSVAAARLGSRLRVHGSRHARQRGVALPALPGTSPPTSSARCRRQTAPRGRSCRRANRR